ncbi:PBP1A family penicillin-binding protein [uncultured Thiodictyon sp.]|uniref:penicillin-binding protein 1A n=1 Tax=uncultured Thiodictyon sp. TaxID=1846217 RepID=UPI0025F95A76|nr:PBP1A family penicillin-binding protein [uncultured Thiodictyon sp.]
MNPLRRVLVSLLGLLLSLAGAGLLAAAVVIKASLEHLARTEAPRESSLAQPLRIFSADGLLIGEFGAERRLPVPLGAIPAPLIQAFLAAEDNRFYAHYGIDPRGLARAAWHYLTTGVAAQGGSTITMQLARNLSLTPEKTFERKLAELLLALHLERTLTKQEILTLYLNRVFFGHRAYGVGAAAALYYDKPLTALTLAESAMLAAIPKAPSTDNPVTHPDHALARRDHILGRMAALGFIDQTTYRTALAEPDQARLHQRPPELDAGYAAEMARRTLFERFGEDAYRRGYRVTTTIDARLQRAAQEAVREAIQAYDRRHGYRGAEARPAVNAGPGANPDEGADLATLDALLARTDDLPGLRVGWVRSADARHAEVYLGHGERVTLELAQVQWARPLRTVDQQGPAPRRVDAVLHAGDMIRLRQDPRGHWELAQRPRVTAALLALAPRDGAIRALVGGYRFGADQFNRAADAHRQSGSAFKPFVYAAALARGWTPASLILDAPLALAGTEDETWTPDNFDHRALGPMRLRLALTQSRNLAAIDLLQRVGVDEARAFAARFGFELERLPRNLTLTLGVGLVTLPQLAGAYAVFANGGFRVEPHLIARIEDREGKTVFQTDPPRACTDCWFRNSDAATPDRLPTPEATLADRVLEPSLAYQMHSLLQDVVTRGTGRRVLELHRSDLAGKTGTTNAVRDAWFCGYQKDLVTIAWMGFDDAAPLGRGETGGESAARLWTGFMGEALKGKPEAQLPVPSGMVRVLVHGTDGTPAGPADADAIAEWVREADQDFLAGPNPVFWSADRDITDGMPPTIIDEVF